MLVADGNLTYIHFLSVRSRVVSLRSIHLALFLAELNGLESWGTDIGNVFLKAFTKEKVCAVSGTDFGPL